MIVGASPPVRRVKPEHRASRCSHPGRVLLRRRRVLIVGAPPPVRRVKPEHRASRCSHPGRVLLRRRRVLIVGAPPPVRRVKPEQRASRYSHPGRVLLQERRVLIVGAPPPVRRVSRNTEPAVVRTRGGCSYSNSTPSASSRRVTATTCMPLGASLGALALGTMARVKPCLAASFRRS